MGSLIQMGIKHIHVHVYYFSRKSIEYPEFLGKGSVVLCAYCRKGWSCSHPQLSYTTRVKIVNLLVLLTIYLCDVIECKWMTRKNWSTRWVLDWESTRSLLSAKRRPAIRTRRHATTSTRRPRRRRVRNSRDTNEHSLFAYSLLTF